MALLICLHRLHFVGARRRQARLSPRSRRHRRTPRSALGSLTAPSSLRVRQPSHLPRRPVLAWAACGIRRISAVSAMLRVGCLCSHLGPWKGSGAATPPREVGGAGPSASKHIQSFLVPAFGVYVCVASCSRIRLRRVTQEQRRFRREPSQERPDFKGTLNPKMSSR